MSADATYPNVRAWLRLTRKAPGLPLQSDEQRVWLSGRRFRLRDESGRELNEILGDVTSPRGLGMPARTIEDFMDRTTAIRDKPRGPTELFGDLESGRGWVCPPRMERWEIEARALASVAEQILESGRPIALVKKGNVTRLGRAAVEYEGLVTAVEGDATFYSDVTRIIALPYILYELTRNHENVDHFLSREILSLEEGVVTESELQPADE